MTETDSPRDPRIYMAAERTFLAWVRTGLALMAFGFVIARMAVAFPQTAGDAPADASGIWFGIALIVAGVATTAAASVRHSRYVRAIDHDNFRAAFGTTLGHTLVGAVIAIGLVAVLLLLPS